MAQMHGGHIVARALKNEGVEVLFTVTGGHILPILDGCVQEGIRVVDFRHEQAAAHAAEADVEHSQVFESHVIQQQ